MSRGQQFLTPNKGGGYDDNALGLTDLLAYWPFRDSAEPVGRIAEDISGNDFAGLYFTTGVTYNIDGPDGDPAINLDGTGNVCLYSAPLALAYNDSELSIACFVRIASAQWTDGSARYITNFGFDAGTEFTAFRKDNSNNRIMFLHFGSGVNQTFVHTFSPQNTGWVHVGITVSEANDRVRGYINGVDVGGVSSIGAATQGLSAQRGTIGSTACTGAFTPFIGDVARLVLVGREISATEMAGLATT